MRKPDFYIKKLKRIQARISKAVIEKMRTSKEAHKIDRFEHGDFIYNIDLEAEKILLEEFRKWGKEEPVLLVAEGLGRRPFGAEKEEDCKTIVVVDPIDGTREIMFSRRPAWALAGVAPYRKDATLDDIWISVQTSIGKNIFGEDEALWAVKGKGAYWQKGKKILRLKTLQDEEIEHRFITFQSYFEGLRKPVTDIQERVLSNFVRPQTGKALTFEDTYLSTGGLIYMMATGRQSAIIDFRPQVGKALGNHVYDLSAHLIAKEAGASADFYVGNKKSKVPLSLDSKFGMRFYANKKLKNKLDPVIDKALLEKGY